MTTYTPITDAETSHMSPLTISKERRWRDNPIAITEGAAGAPKIQPKALASPFLGVLTGSGQTPGGYTNVGWVSVYRFAFSISAAVSVSTSLQVSFSTDNGATWGAWQSIPGATVASGEQGLMGEVVLNLTASQSASMIGMVPGGGATVQRSGFGTITPPANYNAVRLRNSLGNGFAALGYAIAGY